jgi:hypothetical protein
MTLEVEPPIFITDVFNSTAFIPKQTLTLEEAKNRFVSKPTLIDIPVDPTPPIENISLTENALGQ